jgi:hypothetical protein
MSRLRNVLSVSNVVAFTALFVALGGSVYAAGTLTGSQIRKNSLPGNRVKAKTIAANRLKPNSLTTRQVKNGSLRGKDINQRTLTAVDAAGLASVNYASVTLPLPGDGSAATATANCPAGTHAIGGGATLSNDDRGRVNDMGPSPLRTGWEATAFSWFSGTTMTVTAVCVKVANPSGAVNALPQPPVKYNPYG